MKKKIFNVWYNEYGKELAKNALPIDDVDEKEIRRKAKEIFSYTYALFSEFMCDRLSPIHEIQKLYKTIQTCIKFDSFL